MDGQVSKQALFALEGPDQDGSVWIISTGTPGWRHNLGPAAKAAEVMAAWLASVVAAVETFPLTQDE